MHERTATVKSKYGIHARPSAVICIHAKSYPETEILLVDPINGSIYDANSILMILTMSKKCGDVVIVRASGKREKEAVEDIAMVIETYEIEDL